MSTRPTASSPTSVDAVIIGAGFSGLYQLHQLREAGFKALAFDAAGGVGGTWYWNRYPGARVDCQFPVYQYTFSQALVDKWNWQERFPGQEETERYLNFCADELDLRKDIRLNTRITSARFDETTKRWQVTTDHGDHYDAQYFIPCTGILSAPVIPFPGKEKFRGRLCHTAYWPREKVDFTGQRVGVVGSGATAMQVIQTIASEVGQLKVFQRTAQYAITVKNPKLTDADRDEVRKNLPAVRQRMKQSFGGLGFDLAANGSFHDHTPEERQKLYEETWADGSLRYWIGVYPEVLFDEQANAEVSEFARRKIRAQLKDPKIADRLTPTYRFGTRRVPLQYGYYEAFNLDTTELVDVKEDPIECITEKGLKLKSGAEHEVDILIFATGFDAGRTLSRLEIRGRGGITVKDIWDKDLRTTMGLQLHGFPNMFIPSTGLAPAGAFCNIAYCLQQQGQWITETLEYLRDHGLKVIEPTAEFEDAWVQHHDELVNASLFPKTNTWYMGDNIGRKRRLIGYLGGNPDYEQRLKQVQDSGYAGFALA
ncbi:MAG: NAD(P)/FAD-dependent oxidoreductase [Nevskiaceae bacterium]|nr:MAG: NAD(P)/FAD-dependent oxidoreductase [Nevskiaceae bacterium]TBR71539.1 MAG: NAD(P)/FAD-dependent oxidoreductase [Nevskiaceae bacterium]